MDVKVPVNQTPQVQPIGQPSVMNISEMGSSPKAALSAHGLTKIIAGVTVLLLVSGVGVGVYLVGQQQQVNSRASNQDLSNIANVVPKEVINPAATLSAQPKSATPAASTDASPGTTLEDIRLPELEDTIESSDEAVLKELVDFNSDGAINSVDLSFIYAAWGTPQSEEQSKADLNDDGIINGLDYSLILEHYGK